MQYRIPNGLSIPFLSHAPCVAELCSAGISEFPLCLSAFSFFERYALLFVGPEFMIQLLFKNIACCPNIFFIGFRMKHFLAKRKICFRMIHFSFAMMARCPAEFQIKHGKFSQNALFEASSQRLQDLGLDITGE